MIWPGPPIDAGERPGQPADRRAGRRARGPPRADGRGEAQIEAFAATLDDAQKNEQLTKLFARTLEIINNDRSSIIEGIKEYARGQRTLAQSINAKNERLIELPKDQVLERDALVAERDWDVRIYDDRARSLTYLCEQPVLLEQRAFALARAIAGTWRPAMHRSLICVAGRRCSPQAPAQAHELPDRALADYVFGCMATNGQTQEALEKCSCSIDVIASIIPFEEYEAGETVLRMRQVRGGGEKMALFTETAVAKDAVDRLRRAQIEAELRCF